MDCTEVTRGHIWIADAYLNDGIEIRFKPITLEIFLLLGAIIEQLENHLS